MAEVVVVDEVVVVTKRVVEIVPLAKVPLDVVVRADETGVEVDDIVDEVLG